MGCILGKVVGKQLVRRGDNAYYLTKSGELTPIVNDIYGGTIGKSDFDECRELRSISVPEGVETIGESAFRRCHNLRTVELPSSLKTIEKEAFARCSRLTTVRFREGLKRIGEGAFKGCSNLKTFDLPSTLKTIDKEAFLRCSGLVSVHFQNGLEIVGEGAFKGCSNLKTVAISSTLKTIQTEAFFRCIRLSDVIFREGLEIIGEGAFKDCSELNTFRLPSTLKQIQAFSFSNCEQLKHVDIPEGTERLGTRAFSGCGNLQTVILPLSLVEIGNAFLGCELLSDVQFPPEMPQANKEPIQNNTILHQLLDYKYPLTFIKPFLESCPTAIKERNTLGQTPLHLCMTNHSYTEVTNMIYKLWPEALNERNEIGKTPLDYCDELHEDSQFLDLPPRMPFTQQQNGNWTLLNYPELVRCQHLMLEVPESDDEMLHLVPNSSETLRNYFHRQLFTRELLFGKLLEEFARQIEFKDKLVIQRAAAAQVLCGTAFLTKCLKRHVDFRAFSSSALWYQQEILKLVLRIYHEDQAWNHTNIDGDVAYHPSALDDAKYGQDCLERGAKPVAGPRKDSFIALSKWIVQGLQASDYTLEAPVVKPLQSLFNKVYIRRGQTKTGIVGDMTRATLYLKNKAHVLKVIGRIKNEFPDITSFESPDSIGVEEFMNQVFQMKRIPRTQVIPYRLKVNSSQNTKDTPLLYNLNFFDEIPEYHWVGLTKMFVAFELQIGLRSEIEYNRKDHMAYGRRRILNSQSLLNDYISATSNNSAGESLLASAIGVNNRQHDSDFKVMTAILEGNFSNLNLRALDDIELCGDKEESLYLGKFDRLDLGRPHRMCLNNKRLNRWMKEGKAHVLDQVSTLDPSIQYCVKSLQICWRPSASIKKAPLYVGLFAHFGPYMISVASRCIGHIIFWGYIVKPEVNFETLERISPLPVGCRKVLLICWGEPGCSWGLVRDHHYGGMRLLLQQYAKEMPPRLARRADRRIRRNKENSRLA